MQICEKKSEAALLSLVRLLDNSSPFLPWWLIKGLSECVLCPVKKDKPPFFPNFNIQFLPYFILSSHA